MTPSRPSLARRAFPALVLTGASGLLLSALDRPGGSADASTIDAGQAAGTADGGVTVVSVVSAPSAATTVPPAPVTTVPETTVPAVVLPVPVDPNTTAAPTTAAPTTVASTVPPAPVTTAAATCTVLDGPTVGTKWGPVQVEASVTADGHVCSVRALQVPSGTPRSIRINNRAVPLLGEQAVAVSAEAPGRIDGVSGATFTSSAYRVSLQAILDAARTTPPASPD